MLDEKLQLIDYDTKWQKEVIFFIDQAYKDVGYSGLELDSLDKDLTQIETIYNSPSCFKLLLSEDQQKIIASIAIKINKNKEAELKRVAVAKSCRRQGLAKKLSNWAFNYVQDQGISKLHIWSGTLCGAAHKLYSGLGAIDQNELRHLGGIDNCDEKHFIKEF